MTGGEGEGRVPRDRPHEGAASSYPGTARTGHPRSVVTHVT